jgi:hypothetical protein
MVKLEPWGKGEEKHTLRLDGKPLLRRHDGLVEDPVASRIEE